MRTNVSNAVKKGKIRNSDKNQPSNNRMENLTGRRVC